MISAERIQALKALGYEVIHYPVEELGGSFDCEIWQGHAPGGHEFQDSEPGYTERESWAWCDEHQRQSS